MHPKPPSAVALQDLFSLKGRVAVVTGGCQNFGLEIATGLGEAGADLAITSRDPAKAESAARTLANHLGVRVLGLGLDVTDGAAVERVFETIQARYGRIDVLVNNAGGHVAGATGTLQDETPEVWRQYLEINLTGAFLCMRAAVRHMAPARRGSIVNIASVTSLVGRDRAIYEGFAGFKNPVPYTAAKAGVIGLTYDAAADLGRLGIRVNAISPGGFERGQPPAFIADYARRTMLGRMGRDGRDLKGVAVFLASDAADYVTGHNLVVDGGFTRFK